MKVTTVRYSQLFNTGDYQNKKFEVEALLENDETLDSVFDALQNIVLSQKLQSDAKEEYLDIMKELSDYTNNGNKPLSEYAETYFNKRITKLETKFPNKFDFSFFDSLPKVQQIEAEIKTDVPNLGF